MSTNVAKPARVASIGASGTYGKEILARAERRSGIREARMGMSGDVVKRLYDAFAKGDVPAVLASFDPKIEWREADGFLFADGNPIHRTTGRGRGGRREPARLRRQAAVASPASPAP